MLGFSPIAGAAIAAFASTAGSGFVALDYTNTYAVQANTVLVSADFTSTYAIANTGTVLVSADYTNRFAISNGGSMSFTPSVARTVIVQAASRAFTAGDFWTLADPKKPKGLKDPDSTLDITFDWAPWLADISDTLLSAEFILAGGLASVGELVEGTLATVFVSDGVTGVASITCRIVTASVPARIEDRTIYLTIEDR